MDRRLWLSLGILALALGCARPEPEDPADLIVQNGRIYTFGWAEPAPDGAPASGAPHSDSGWSPDAQAVAVKDGEILFVGSNAEVERMTPEEAVRGYTIWGAYAGGLENETGTLEVGKWADITIMDIDPLVVGATEPGKLFDGSIVATIVGGKVLYEAE